MVPLSGYSALQIALHWSVALLILLQVLSHESIIGLLDAIDSAQEPSVIEIVLGRAHVILGLSVFLLGLVRLGVRVRDGAPPPLDDSPLRAGLAKLTHVVLYALILLMPISGALAWFADIELAARAHTAAKYVLIPMVALHLTAAVYHHVVLKDGILKRMIRPSRM